MHGRKASSGSLSDRGQGHGGIHSELPDPSPALVGPSAVSETIGLCKEDKASADRPSPSPSSTEPLRTARFRGRMPRPEASPATSSHQKGARLQKT